MRIHLSILSILVLSLFLAPMKTSAAKPFCACYFGPQNDCTQVGLADGLKDLACKTACGNQYKNLTKYVYLESVSMSGKQTVDCKIAHDAATSPLAEDTKAVVPKLQVDIPTVKFSLPKRSSKVFEANFLGDYLSGIYKYLISISGMLAIVMILVGGLQYVFGAGARGEMKKGQERIKNAVTGLVLILGVYVILYLINPRLTIFPSLSVLIPPRYEIEDVLDPNIGNDAKGAGDKVIDNLIGSLPATYKKCSKEAANYAALALHNLKVCVGPCHCAFTASRFLKYIGCNVSYNGSAPLLTATVDQNGWVTEKITSANRKNLDMGLASTFGHVGVILGDDWSFDSGSTIGRVSNSCPKTFMETLGNASLCGDCAKIPQEAPSTGRFGDPKLGGISGAGGCKSNQGWTVRKGLTFWTVVVRPLRPGEADHPRVCCIIKSKKWYITKTLCDEMEGTQTGNAKDQCKNVKK